MGENELQNGEMPRWGGVQTNKNMPGAWIRQETELRNTKRASKK